MTSSASAAEALLARAEAACFSNDIPSGSAAAQEALDLALAEGHAALKARAQGLLARLALLAGDFETAVRQGEQALAHAAQHGPPRLLTSVSNALAFAYNIAGLPALAVDHGLRALETARSTGDRTGESVALDRLGSIIRGSDESTHAIGMLEASVRLARSLPAPDAAFWPLNNLTSRWLGEADRLIHLGRDPTAALAAAQSHADEAENLAKATGKTLEQALINANIAGIHRRRGQYDAARTRFTAAITLAHANNAHVHEATFQLARASLEVEAHPTAAGCEALEQALRTYKGSDPGLPLRSRRVLASAWRRLGESDRACDQLERLLTDTLADAGKRADMQLRLMCTRDELTQARHEGERTQLELDLQRTRAAANAHIAKELAGHRDRLANEVEARTAELQRALAAAEAASRAKTAFLAVVGHELRTPLNGVIGLVGLARRRSTDDQQAAQLDKSLAAAWDLNRVVDRLMEFVAETGTQAPRVDETDLRAVIDGVLSAVRPLAKAKGLALLADVAAEVPARVRIDGGCIARVLESLLDNAVKFSGRGTVRLQLRWESGGDGASQLLLLVADQGIGMAPDLVERLFRPFELGDVSATRAQGGLGIGLALVHRWVTSLGGSITVTSEPERGSRFQVSVPVQRPS